MNLRNFPHILTWTTHLLDNLIKTYILYFYNLKTQFDRHKLGQLPKNTFFIKKNQAHKNRKKTRKFSVFSYTLSDALFYWNIYKYAHQIKNRKK